MAGPSCSPTPRISLRSAPRNWATWPDCSRNSTKRNCKIIGLSVDPVSSHGKWAADIEETQGHKVNYPMIGDPELKIAKLYDMLPADAGQHVRGPYGGHQRHGAHRVRGRPGQEDQADAQLPDEHRPQLRRSAARARFDAAHRQASGLHAGELEARARTSSSAAAFRTTRRGRSIPKAGSRRGLTSGSLRSRRKRPGRRGGVIFKQFYLPCLAHASYIIGDEATGTAAWSTRSATLTSTSPLPPSTA